MLWLRSQSVSQENVMLNIQGEYSPENETILRQKAAILQNSVGR